METGNPQELRELINGKVHDGIHKYYTVVRERNAHAKDSVEAGRAYVHAYVPHLHFVERLCNDAVTPIAHGAGEGGHMGPAGNFAEAQRSEGRALSPTTIRFLKAGMVYFVLGTFLGVLLSLPFSRDILYRVSGARWGLAHTHLNLAGFVVMIIFGIAYHILPRFAGKPLHSESWAASHFWIATLATAGMAIGFVAPVAAPLLWVGSVAQFAGIVLGIANLWITIR